MLQDLRYAARSLARMRGVAVVAILTLALGIGATTTMFAVVYAALLRPPPFAEPDGLMMLFVTRTTPQEGQVRLRWSVPIAERLDELASSYEATATVTGASIALGGDGAAEQIDGEMVSHGYFGVLRAVPAAGRVFRREEDTAAGAHPLAIVSDRLWRRRYGADPALVGRTIWINGVALTVIGILPEGVRRRHRQGRRVDAAHHGAGADLFRLSGHPPTLRQRRRAAAARGRCRSGQRRAGGHRRPLGGCRRPRRRAVGCGGAVDRRSTGRAGDPAIRVAAAGRGRLRAPGRVRQRHGTAARARPHPPA